MLITGKRSGPQNRVGRNKGDNEGQLSWDWSWIWSLLRSFSTRQGLCAPSYLRIVWTWWNRTLWPNEGAPDRPVAQKHACWLRTRSQRAHACLQSWVKRRADRGHRSPLTRWGHHPLCRTLETVPFCEILQPSSSALHGVWSVTQSRLTIGDHMDCSRQAPLRVGFPRQKYWSRLSIATPGDLPTQGSNSSLLCLLHWQADALHSVTSTPNAGYFLPMRKIRGKFTNIAPAHPLPSL